MEYLWIVLISIAVLYLLYWLIRFALADADVNLLRHSLKPGYYEGKVVWVTGASSGIGEELSMQLSRLGAKVILSARSKDKLEKVRERVAHPENCEVLVLDLESRESVGVAAEKAMTIYGRIDILVNNGAVAHRSFFSDFEEKWARKVMEINFFGTVSLTRDVLRVMEKQPEGGHVVSISSVGGKIGRPLRHYYSASKFALIGIMDCLRLEFMGKNISFTNVCPGPVNTNVSINALKADGSKYGKTDELIAKGMRVERCAELILVAICNRVRETWISKHPVLLLAYLAQYMPSLAFYELKGKAANLQKDAVNALNKKEE